jgi:hypothetical protein
LRIGDQSAGIRFAFREAERERFPSMAFDITVSCLGFSGQNDGVWFEKETLERFVKDLREFEKRRQGRVTLESIDNQSEYCEFRFELFSTGASGTMAVKAELLQVNYLGNGELAPLKVSVAFDIDPGRLNDIIADFEDRLRLPTIKPGNH